MSCRPRLPTGGGRSLSRWREQDRARPGQPEPARRSASSRVVGDRSGGAAGTGTRTLSSDEGSRSAAGLPLFCCFPGVGAAASRPCRRERPKQRRATAAVDGSDPGPGPGPWHRARAHGCRRVRCRFHGESTGADPGRAGDCFAPLRLRGPPSRGAAGSHGRKKEVRIGKIQRMK